MNDRGVQIREEMYVEIKKSREINILTSPPSKTKSKTM